MTDYDLLKRAKRLGTEAGCSSARARGLEDWDDLALHHAHIVETAVLENHRAAPPQGPTTSRDEERREQESNRGCW